MKVLAIPLLLGILAQQTDQPDPCDRLSLRPFYDSLEDGQVLSTKLIAEPPDFCSEKTQVWSDNKAFYFLECSIAGDNRVVLSTPAGLLQLTVEEYPWRPLRARWINEKLLYLRFSWNPRAGAYWIFDVDRRRSVASERWLQDLQALQRCYGSESDRPNEGANGPVTEPEIR
jgi:hypothetical protein